MSKKKYYKLLWGLAIIAALSGCSGKDVSSKTTSDSNTSNSTETTEALSVETYRDPDANPELFMGSYEAAGLTMKVVAASPSTGIIEFSYEANDAVGSGELETSSFYTIEKNNGERWEALPFLDENIAWYDDAWSVMHNEWYAVNWSDQHGSLLPGKYRIVKEVICNHTIEGYKEFYMAAEFEITDEQGTTQGTTEPEATGPDGLKELQKLGLYYDVQVDRLNNGRTYAYSVYFDDGVSDEKMEEVSHAVQSYMIPYTNKNTYLGFVSFTKEDERIFICLDAEDVSPDYEGTAIQGILKALESVKGIKQVIVN